MTEEAQVFEPIKVRGFFRVQIQNPDGTIAGDSGLKENLVTNQGKLNFLVNLLGALAGSSQITHAALGTGAAPIATDTTLAGEVVKRAAVTAASNGSTSVQFTATFSSANSFVTNTQNISNIGLFATSTAAAGTIFAGNTYTSSACATNQNVNVTYTITFS